jgi:hypothetical protein
LSEVETIQAIGTAVKRSKKTRKAQPIKVNPESGFRRRDRGRVSAAGRVRGG